MERKQGAEADLRHDKAFGNAKQLMRRSAKPCLSCPSLIKGGFIIGGEGGNRRTDGARNAWRLE